MYNIGLEDERKTERLTNLGAEFLQWSSQWRFMHNNVSHHLYETLINNVELKFDLVLDFGVCNAFQSSLPCGLLP